MPVSPKRYQPPNSWRTQKPSFWTTYKSTFLIILICLSALAVLHRFDRNGKPQILAVLIKVPQIRSKALRRASWDTMVDTSKPTRRLNPFSRPRRAFASSVYTDNFVPLALALGYSISHTNDLHAQNADMVLFVRQGANVSDASIARLRKVGWKVRVEDDIALPGVEVDQIEPWHKWNLNKLRVWTWTEYERVLFIDADTLVKGDLSEVWKMPGGIANPSFGKIEGSDCRRSRLVARQFEGQQIQFRSSLTPAFNGRVRSSHTRPVCTGYASPP
jgi:hypothetical protein